MWLSSLRSPANLASTGYWLPTHNYHSQKGWIILELQLEILHKEFVHHGGNDGQICHASTMALAHDGTLVASWFEGSAEGNDDVSIYWACQQPGSSWGKARRIPDHPQLPHWNPILHTDGATMHLFFKVGRRIETWSTWVASSKNNGRTWSAAVPLVPGDLGGRGPVRNKILQTANSHWLAPASLEGNQWRSFVDRSEDRGRTWQMSSPITIKPAHTGSTKGPDSAPPVSPQSFTGRGVIQPALWQSRHEHIHMLMRSSEEWIFRSDSSDNGRTWSQPYATDIPNNNSAIDVTQTRDGALVLVCNPVQKNWGPRSPLSVFTSTDNGATWQRQLDLEDETGEFSYPCVLAVDDVVHVSYTWRRQRIAHCILTQQEQRPPVFPS